MATAHASYSGHSAHTAERRLTSGQGRAAASAKAEAGEVAYEDFVQAPRAYEPEPRVLSVFDARVEGARHGMRALGIGVIATAIVLHFVRGGGEIRDSTALLGAAVVLLSGVALIVQSFRGRVRRTVPLLWLSQTDGVFRVREYAEQETLNDSREHPNDDVESVLFARRLVTMPGSGAGSKIEMAGVFLRMASGAVWPVIPSTLAAEEAFRIAQALGIRLGISVKQVGRGWDSEAPEAPRVLH